MKPPVSLPVVQREVFDHSILSTHCACPRKAFYSYVLDRSGNGNNPHTRFGTAYHKYRYYLEKQYLAAPSLDSDKLHDMHVAAAKYALNGWVNPPLDHKAAHLDAGRLYDSFNLGFDQFCHEKERGVINVIQVEVPFDLQLPSGKRYGGVIDRIEEENGLLWIRDYKTMSRAKARKSKGDPLVPMYPYKPHHQFTGYVWGGQILSGREIQGVKVDGLYNTEKQGPELLIDIQTRTQFDIDQFIDWAEEELKLWEEHYETMKWPMRTTACNNYGGCFYRGACSEKDSWWGIEGWLEDKTEHYHWNFQEGDEE